MEKFIFKTGALIIFVYPIPFLFLKYGILSYVLLGLYCISIIVAFFFLKKHYCSYCINFACPLNNVDKEIRSNFFAKNQVVKDAWGEFEIKSTNR
jgi:hypothetical protein